MSTDKLAKPVGAWLRFSSEREGRTNLDCLTRSMCEAWLHWSDAHGEKVFIRFMRGQSLLSTQSEFVNQKYPTADMNEVRIKK